MREKKDVVFEKESSDTPYQAGISTGKGGVSPA